MYKNFVYHKIIFFFFNKIIFTIIIVIFKTYYRGKTIKNLRARIFLCKIIFLFDVRTTTGIKYAHDS